MSSTAPLHLQLEHQHKGHPVKPSDTYFMLSPDTGWHVILTGLIFSPKRTFSSMTATYFMIYSKTLAAYIFPNGDRRILTYTGTAFIFDQSTTRAPVKLAICPVGTGHRQGSRYITNVNQLTVFCFRYAGLYPATYDSHFLFPIPFLQG